MALLETHEWRFTGTQIPRQFRSTRPSSKFMPRTMTNPLFNHYPDMTWTQARIWTCLWTRTWIKIRGPLRASIFWIEDLSEASQDRQTESWIVAPVFSKFNRVLKFNCDTQIRSSGGGQKSMGILIKQHFTSDWCCVHFIVWVWRGFWSSSKRLNTKV